MANSIDREASSTATQSTAEKPRRPYVAPVLRHLGNVRTVTLNGGMTTRDNPITGSKRAM